MIIKLMKIKIQSVITRLLLLIFFLPLTLNAFTLDAYLSAFSVEQGGSIQVMVSTDAPQYKRSIYRIGNSTTTLKTLVQDVVYFPGQIQAINADAYKNGAGWSTSYVLNIPVSWQSGIYELRMTPVGGGNSTLIQFTVKPAGPQKSDVLVIDNSTTDVAYNGWGGKSLYAASSSAGVPSTELSLLRPGQNKYQTKQAEFSAWAISKNISLDFASMMDLHSNPALLTGYKAVVFAGHNEYWSKEMRHQYDQYVEGGGRIFIMSGNTMWWQIRFQGNSMISYKASSTSDPYNQIDPTQVTGHFSIPESQSTGVSFKEGGYINYSGHYMAAQGFGGYTVTNANHWIYNNTGLNDGDTFGQEMTIAGYEVDGLDYVNVGGKLVPTGNDGAPTNYQILAVADAYNEVSTASSTHGHAVMGLFRKGNGWVFNAATVDWADGLWSFTTNAIADQNVSKITYNVLSRFIAKDIDADTVVDNIDNCIDVQNIDQVNSDNDVSGNACDQDDDNDGVTDEVDAFPLDSAEKRDSDGDGIGDNADLSVCGNGPVQSCSTLRGDINGDNKVNVQDLLLLEKILIE